MMKWPLFVIYRCVRTGYQKKKKNPKTLRAYSTKGNKKMSNPTINLFDVKSIFIIFRNTFDTNVRVFSRDTLSVNIEF